MAPDSEARRNRWSDLSRPPLNATALRRALVRPGGLWRELTVVESVSSTNTELVERVHAGEAAEGTVLVAEEQTRGRGRLDRQWSAPPRSGIFFSVVLTPRAPVERWGWLTLLAGVATASALSRSAGVDTALKWPNDLLVTVSGEERKFGGILAERAVAGAGARSGERARRTPQGTGPHGEGPTRQEPAAGAEPEPAGSAGPEPAAGAQPEPGRGAGGAGQASIVIGIGLNVSLGAEELPVSRAGSLTLAGAPGSDRDPLLRAVLRSLEQWYERWDAADGDPGESQLLEAYAAGCVTLGRSVRAELPGGGELVGEAVAVDGDGQLVLATGEGVQRPIAAGDIVHLRTVAEG